MISSQNSQTFSEPNFKRNEQRDGLHRVVASIYIVAHEQVVGVRERATNFKQFK